MKKYILLLILAFAFCDNYAQSYSSNAIFTPLPWVSTTRNLQYQVLEDGIYKVRVKYESSAKHRATYVLRVKVQSDTVTHIYFDNGGVLRKTNVEDYSWVGGGIAWNVDFLTKEIKSGMAEVAVHYHGQGWQLFTIYF